MANSLLFRSAVILGSYNVWLAIRYAPFILEFILILGVVTSVWNHGTTSSHAKWFDRVTIVLVSAIDFIYMSFLPRPWALFAALMLGTAILLYFGAKFAIRNGTCGDKFHLGAHLIGTMIHSLVFGLYLTVVPEDELTQLLFSRIHDTF
jgi:hypothetical protein